MIRIRDATVEDVPFIKEMMWEAILFSPVLIRGSGLDYLRREQDRYWEKWLENRRPVFVAENSEGQSLGVLSLRPHIDIRRSGYSHELYAWEMGIGVVAEFRRQGVGKRLIEHAMAYCRETGMSYLALTVDPTNRTAQTLYRKMGFRIISKRHGVIEMRVSFEPPYQEDPEIVANRRYFIQYWSQAEYRSGRVELYHCAPYHVESKWFKRVGLKPHDYVYIVTVIKGGLHLVVKYEVEKLLITLEEIKEEFSEADPGDFDPNSDHLLTEYATLYSFEPPIDEDVAQALRLLDKGEAKPLPLNRAGYLDGHSLRGVREITPASASLLDGFVEQFRYP